MSLSRHRVKEHEGAQVDENRNGFCHAFQTLVQIILRISAQKKQEYIEQWGQICLKILKVNRQHNLHVGSGGDYRRNDNESAWSIARAV